MIHISLSPNLTFKDVLLAVKAWHFPSRLQEGPDIGSLEQAFASLHGGATFSFFSGRHCLSVILEALEIKPGDEIILQGFTCVVLANAIRHAGGTPVYVDIDRNTCLMDHVALKQALTKKTKAVLIQHSFGNVEDIDTIQKIIGPNIILINDCAQSLGATYKGKPLGCYGDISFFSFGRDKMISCVNGGMIVTQIPQWSQKIQAIYHKTAFPPKRVIRQNLFHILASALMLPSYRFLSLGKFLLVLFQKCGFLPLVLTKEEKEGIHNVPVYRMPNALCPIASHQLSLLPHFMQVRKEITQVYTQSFPIKHVTGIQLTEYTQGLLRYSIFVGQPKKLKAWFQKKGIVLGDWYHQPIGPEGASLQKAGYTKCPESEWVSRHIVNLPTHHRMTIKKAKQLVGLLKKYTSLYGNTGN